MSETLSSVNWAAIISAVTLLTSIIGAMMTVFYRLILSNIAKTTALYDERVQHAVKTFEASMEARDRMERERHNSQQSDIDGVAKRLDRVDGDLRAMLRELPRIYVSRDEHMKQVTVLEMKVDRIGENILQLAKEGRNHA